MMSADFLLTYAASPLRLLCIGGLSAGETANGILGSRDCILLAAAGGAVRARGARVGEARRRVCSHGGRV